MKLHFLFLSLSILLPNSVLAENRSQEELLAFSTPEEIGQQIAIEFDNRDLGFHSQISTMEMVLKNAHGGHNNREMESRIYERPSREVGDLSMLLFFNPADINGTALLSHAEILKPDNQWLYLPALKRVKRISSKNKSGPFVGSEFAYEDITGNEIGKYTWRYEGVEPCPTQKELTCFKLLSTPKYKHSGYTKRLSWVDTTELRLHQIDFYDRKDEKFKTQTNHGYKQYLNKHWRAHRWEMVNHQTNKSTTLLFKNYKFNTGLSKRDFTKASLKRVR